MGVRMFPLPKCACLPSSSSPLPHHIVNLSTSYFLYGRRGDHHSRGLIGSLAWQQCDMCQTGSMRHTLSRSRVPWMDRQVKRTAGWNADLFRFLRNCREGRGGAFRPTLAVFLLTHISAIFFPYRVLFYTVYSDYASLASLAHSAKHVSMISPSCVSLTMTASCFFGTCSPARTRAPTTLSKIRFFLLQEKGSLVMPCTCCSNVSLNLVGLGNKSNLVIANLDIANYRL